MFYKASDTDDEYHINRLAPVTNSEVATYSLRGVGRVEGTSGQTAFSSISFEIQKNCDLESITETASLPLSDVSYTFGATQVTTILPASTSSMPSVCPIHYFMQVKESDGTWKFLATSSFTPFMSFNTAIRQLSVHYDTDNEFSPVTGVNTIELRQYLKLNNEVTVTAYQPFNLQLTKDCQYATISADTSSHSFSYQVNDQNTAGDFDFGTFTVSDSYCDVTYKV